MYSVIYGHAKAYIVIATYILECRVMGLVMKNRKIRKLLTNPKSFFVDAINNRIRRSNRKTIPDNKKIITYTFGFSTWKQFLRKYFPERQFEFFPKGLTEKDLPMVKEKLLSSKNIEIFIWGINLDEKILSFIKESNIPHYFIEDGFIRSVKLGAVKSPPRSLSLDSRTPYFDARGPSDLEVLLSTYDFAKHPELLARSRRLISLMIKNNISKYNNSRPIDVEKIYGEKNKKRILVVGQVEDDASIKYGCNRPITNYDLLKMACDENPDAQIFYKEHPDVLAGARQSNSNMQALKARCQLLMNDFPLSQALTSIDHVYTISSLSGFEALLRGIKVTTLGCPFYSGWGLTDDRQANTRRQRTLSVEELFAGAYILYPKYFDPNTGDIKTPEEVISDIVHERKLLLDSSVENKKPSVRQSVKESTRSANVIQRADLTICEGALSWLSTTEIDKIVSPDTGKIVYLYLPWENWADNESLLIDEKIQFLPFDLIKFSNINNSFNDVENYAKMHPDKYRRIVVSRLAPYCRYNINGVIFRDDASVISRIISFVCDDLGIVKILLPKSHLLMDETGMFSNDETKASIPLADVVLCSSSFERRVLDSRGYSENKIIDVVHGGVNYKAEYVSYLNKDKYNLVMGIPRESKHILLLSSLDEQLLNSGFIEEAVQWLLDYVVDNEFTLVIREQSCNGGAFYRELVKESLCPPNAIIIEDDAFPLTTVREAIQHASVVVSFCHDTILNVVCSGKGAIYISPSISSVNSLYDKRLASVHTYAGLHSALDSFISCEDLNVVKDTRTNSSNQISLALVEISKRNLTASNAVNRLFSCDAIDVAAIPSNQQTFDTSQKYLRRLLKVRCLLSSSGEQNCNLEKLSSAEIFFQWGIRDISRESKNRIRQNEICKKLSRPMILIEDGFIRSIDIGLSGEPGLSIIMDDTTAYYDATKVSRLSRVLEHGRELMDDEISRARNAIRKIVSSKVSKYNHAPDLPVKIGTAGRTKVLLIDQRFGDQSVTSGLASENSFERMLMDAVKNNPDKDIIIKQHPDAIKGGKSSYYSDERLSAIKYMDNVYTINFDINPYSLLDLVDDVYVVTSGMGFEALMAGKRVHCYGMPFYAGWGVTDDQISLPSRTRKRSLEELFHFSYIESSRYFDPDKDEVVPVEEIVDYIVRHRGW